MFAIKNVDAFTQHCKLEVCFHLVMPVSKSEASAPLYRRSYDNASVLICKILVSTLLSKRAWTELTIERFAHISRLHQFMGLCTCRILAMQLPRYLVRSSFTGFTRCTPVLIMSCVVSQPPRLTLQVYFPFCSPSASLAWYTSSSITPTDLSTEAFGPSLTADHG